MGAYISRDGLRGGRYAENKETTKASVATQTQRKMDALLAYETKLHCHFCEVFDGQSAVVLG